MKPFAFIMSIAMLALICLPCRDTETGNADNTCTTATTEKQGNHETQGHADHCSPFCACACCSAVYVYTPFICPNLISTPGKIHHFCCYISNLARNAHSIWQPPRLSA